MPRLQADSSRNLYSAVGDTDPPSEASDAAVQIPSRTLGATAAAPPERRVGFAAQAWSRVRGGRQDKPRIDLKFLLSQHMSSVLLQFFGSKEVATLHRVASCLASLPTRHASISHGRWHRIKLHPRLLSLDMVCPNARAMQLERFEQLESLRIERARTNWT